jgi:1-acyl-sn-glycerol-3-phosphate acyltransferase
MNCLWSFLRAVIRLIALLACFAGLALDYLLFPFNRRSMAARSQLLSRWSRRMLKVINVNVVVEGSVTEKGILAANHLSYVDILVLSSVMPQVFVAKKEVLSWPVFGLFAKWGGTLFIDRNRRSDVVAQGSEIERVVAEGELVTIFLEGTSSDGKSVLPFRPSLLEPAIRGGLTVIPTALHYSSLNGQPISEICYHGESSLVPHLWGVLNLDSICSLVSFGHPVKGREDRKSFAVELHDLVSEMKQKLEMTEINLVKN